LGIRQPGARAARAWELEAREEARWGRGRSGRLGAEKAAPGGAAGGSSERAARARLGAGSVGSRGRRWRGPGTERGPGAGERRP
jgi:hypothetical protein